MTDKPKDIHAAILAVYDKIGYVPKRGRIDSGAIKYNFAGEADFIAAIRPEMIEAGIFQHPESMVILSNDRLETKRLAANGNEFVSYQFRVVVQVVYRFTHAESKTSILVPAFGEGMDSGDKAFNKAMTGANKYALRQTFMIETGDDPDKYASHPEGGIDTPDATKNANVQKQDKPKQEKPKQDKPKQDKPSTPAEQQAQTKLSVKVINEVLEGIPKMSLDQLIDIEKKVNAHGVAQRIDKPVWSDMAFQVLSCMLDKTLANDAASIAAIGNKIPPLASIGVLTAEQRSTLNSMIQEKTGATK